MSEDRPVCPDEGPGRGADMESLWTVAEAARFLRKSRRWLFGALRLPPSEPGSIPHVRLGRSPRFDPPTLRAWVVNDCPPADLFKAWRLADERKRKRA